MNEPKQYTIECAVEDLEGIAASLRTERNALSSIRCLLTGGPLDAMGGGETADNGYVHNLELLVGEIRNAISEISNERQAIRSKIERPKVAVNTLASAGGPSGGMS